MKACNENASRPARALWIEMYIMEGRIVPAESRPARALWIEIRSDCRYNPAARSSRPARALWIEMEELERDLTAAVVEAREGLVD